MTQSPKLKGFTLIELIVVMGILAILATIVIIAVNPSRQFAQARNARRQNDVLAVLDAVYQYSADQTSGTVPASIPSVANCATAVLNAAAAAGPRDIGTDATVGANLVAVLATAPNNYLSAIPSDPTSGTAALTRYQICRDSTTNQISVGAPVANTASELNKTIVITR